MPLTAGMKLCLWGLSKKQTITAMLRMPLIHSFFFFLLLSCHSPLSKAIISNSWNLEELHSLLMTSPSYHLCPGNVTVTSPTAFTSHMEHYWPSEIWNAKTQDCWNMNECYGKGWLCILGNLFIKCRHQVLSACWKQTNTPGHREEKRSHLQWLAHYFKLGLGNYYCCAVVASYSFFCDQYFSIPLTI